MGGRGGEGLHNVRRKTHTWNSLYVEKTMAFANLTNALRRGQIQRVLCAKLRQCALVISKIRGGPKDKELIMVFATVQRKPELTSTILPYSKRKKRAWSEWFAMNRNSWQRGCFGSWSRRSYKWRQSWDRRYARSSEKHYRQRQNRLQEPGF
jgi:hypothetical protein